MWTTICPRSRYTFHIVTYYIKWVTTSWTDNKRRLKGKLEEHLENDKNLVGSAENL